MFFDWLIFCVICGPYQEPAGSEGEDVPVGTEGDGDGGDNAEDFEDDAKKFHCLRCYGLINKAVVAERIII